MIRSRREFWIFHATFRLLAGIALFLYGLAYGHVRVAVIRSVYNPLIGFACSYIIRAAIESWFPRVLLK